MFSFKHLTAYLFTAAVMVSLSPALASALAVHKHKTHDCDTSTSVMDLPTGQTMLVAPPTAPLFILLGVGTQNYSCVGTAFTSIGAVASLFDISCLDHTPHFASIQSKAFDVWKDLPASAPLTAVGPLVGAPHLDGFHYFIPSASGTGLSPKWDFTSTTGNPSAFVVGARVGGIPAPTNPAVNIDWLSLNRSDGELAAQIFRVDTVGGQPPASCVAGSGDITVKYTAKYYLY
ncbi:hypothetical protein R3P38DRAFT_3308795 [Favolaschia claudopus]|uniref:Malate dehydrogenase n=1 Tax=Favolaschia claudopus TaxID=2862362 RepID=A0AAW0D2H4_9AGAR